MSVIFFSRTVNGVLYERQRIHGEAPLFTITPRSYHIFAGDAGVCLHHPSADDDVQLHHDGCHHLEEAGDRRGNQPIDLSSKVIIDL